MSSYDFGVYKSLGSIIKNYRQWHALSQETFAESVGVSVRELRRWETDRRRARIENLHDVSEVTGIPMQACVALNADQPIWYSFLEKRFGYSSVEIESFSVDEFLKYHEQSDEETIVKIARISTNREMSMILSCHRDIYGTGKPLKKDVIEAAIEITPDLNVMVFDPWGHYVGHNICLPIKTDVYQQLKKQGSFEDYLTTERISDIVALHKGVFFYYSVFAVSGMVAHTLLKNSARYCAKMQRRKGYLKVCYAATKGVMKACENLGMREVWSYGDGEQIQFNIHRKIYEIEAEKLTEDIRARGFLHIADQIETISKFDPLTPGDPLIPDATNQEKAEILKMKSCPNQKCALYGKRGEGNILFNGTYQTKEGIHVPQFLCKKCNKSFSSKVGSIFYGLRSPEEKILTALTFLAKGMTVRKVAKCLGVKLDTVRHWINVVYEQRKKIDAALMEKLDVSQVELDALWTSVKNNSLRQRAIL